MDSDLARVAFSQPPEGRLQLRQGPHPALTVQPCPVRHCLCSTSSYPAGADGTWQVVTAAAGSSLTGSCTITATVTFQGGIPSLTATTSVALVGLTKLAMYALSPDLASVPAVPPASGLVQADDLLLLQCQPGGYDQVGVLLLCPGSSCGCF